MPSMMNHLLIREYIGWLYRIGWFSHLHRFPSIESHENDDITSNAQWNAYIFLAQLDTWIPAQGVECVEWKKEKLFDCVCLFDQHLQTQILTQFRSTGKIKWKWLFLAYVLVYFWVHTFVWLWLIDIRKISIWNDGRTTIEWNMTVKFSCKIHLITIFVLWFIC